jgi:hypothetical protein
VGAALLAGKPQMCGPVDNPGSPLDWAALVQLHPRDGLVAYYALDDFGLPQDLRRALILLSNEARPDLLFLAWTTELEGRDNSDSQLLEWFGRYPASPQGLISATRVLLKQRRLSEAQEVAGLLEEVFGVTAHSTDLLASVGLLLVAERAPEALDLLQRVVALHGYALDSLAYARGVGFIQRGRLGDALTALNPARNWNSRYDWLQVVERASLLSEAGTPEEKGSALADAARMYARDYPKYLNAHVARYRLRLFEALARKSPCPAPDTPTEIAGGTIEDYTRMVTRMQALAGCVPCELAIAKGTGAMDGTVSIVEFAQCALRVNRAELAISALVPFVTFHVDFLENRVQELPTFHTHLARFWLARAYEASGDRDNAVYWYKRFSGVLAGADWPIPQLLEARAALERLAPKGARDAGP